MARGQKILIETYYKRVFMFFQYSFVKRYMKEDMLRMIWRFDEVTTVKPGIRLNQR